MTGDAHSRREPGPTRRVVVMGVSRSGKTTVAKGITVATGLTFCPCGPISLRGQRSQDAGRHVARRRRPLALAAHPGRLYDRARRLGGLHCAGLFRAETLPPRRVRQRPPGVEFVHRGLQRQRFGGPLRECSRSRLAEGSCPVVLLR
ncbi:MAG: hypothetical protein QOE61_4988 [Micromonosporaceae bacterium]|jgi:gluconokinase|nr:hypothetical protein [Micromonosporaceae bacterium]